MLLRNRIGICYATSQLILEGNKILFLPWGATDEDVTDVSPSTHRVQSCYRYVDTTDAVLLSVAPQLKLVLDIFKLFLLYLLAILNRYKVT